MLSQCWNDRVGAGRRQLSERAAIRRAEEELMFKTHAQQHAWKRAQYGESERSRVFAGGACELCLGNLLTVMNRHFSRFYLMRRCGNMLSVTPES
jgi:hypothetical protein